MSDKPLPPTPKKLRDARKKGQFARSKVLAAGLPTLVMLFAGLLSANSVATELGRLITHIYSALETSPLAACAMALRSLAKVSALACAPLLLTVFASQLATAGWQVDFSQVRFQFERVNPVAGAKRLFTLRNFRELGVALVYAIVVVVALYSPFWNAIQLSFQVTLNAAARPLFVESISVLKTCATQAVVRLTLVIAALTAVDVMLARRRFMKDMMMTHQEVRDEYKQSEGDPHFKSHRRALHAELSKQGPARGVKTANVIVVNPTHVAIALRYCKAEADAPYIVAKGTDAEAFAIRQEANHFGIKIVKNVSLARSLLQCDLGTLIPEEYFQAAAAILAVVISNNENQKERL